MRPREAWNLLEPWLDPLEGVALPRRHALGRVLAEPLTADVDVPGADVSAMDGYAYSGDRPVGTTLPLGGTIAAGDAPGATLPSGSAAAIMTGAPVPQGADRVVPVELTAGTAEGVRLERPVAEGANIRRRAEVLSTGDEILAAGDRLTPGALALVATHGYGEVPVVRPPRVAVLTTGDEVVPPEEQPGPGALRDSHTDFLLAAGRTLGLELEPLGIAPDDPDRLRELVERGLEADLLLIGGGVSMGEFDFVEGVLGSLGCELLFDHVAIQPGKPLVAARHRRGLVLGLPGNPASVMACFWLFARPVIRRLSGIPDGFWKGAVTGRLASALPAAKGRDRFLPATIELGRDAILARPRPAKGSHDLSAWAHGSALVRVRAHAEPAEAGAPCELLPLADWPGEA